jgi:hypothetical protein
MLMKTAFCRFKVDAQEVLGQISGPGRLKIEIGNLN